MDIAGELSGSIIAFLALYYLGKNEAVFRELFAWTLIPGIFSVITVIFFVQDVPYKAKKTIQKIELKDDKKLLPVLFIYFAFIFFIFNDSFFLIKAKESGWSLEYVPLLMIILNLTQTMLSYFFGVRIDKIGSQKILFVSFIFGLSSMIGLYFNQTVLSFVLLGVFTVASLNAIRAYISTNAKNKGSVYGIFYAGVAISGALGATCMGIIWRYFGENLALNISIIALALITMLSKSLRT